MPLHLYYRPSFKRSLKRLGYEQKKIVGLILESLAAYYCSGCNLLEAQKIAPRFFYKQLRKPYCEAGIEGNIHYHTKLFDFLYKNNLFGVFLERKYKRFLEGLSEAQDG